MWQPRKQMGQMGVKQLEKAAGSQGALVWSTALPNGHWIYLAGVSTALGKKKPDPVQDPDISYELFLAVCQAATILRMNFYCPSV